MARPITRAAIEGAAPIADGRLRVHLRVEGVDVAVTQLCGIAGLEVVAPLTLRERLRRHGEELAAANS